MLLRLRVSFMVATTELQPYAACIYCAGFMKVIYYTLHTIKILHVGVCVRRPELQ